MAADRDIIPNCVYEDPECGKTIIDRFRQHRDNGLYLDVTLKVGNQSIRAHRAFLAAFSDYFANMFGGKLQESRENEITMKDIDAVSLSRIIDYAYSGRIEVVPDTENLLRTSNYLVIDFVQASCCDFLLKTMGTSTVVSVLQLGVELGLKHLADPAQLYAAEHISQLASNDSFLEISSDLLITILSDDNLVFTENGFVVGVSRQEQLVLDAVLRYVNHRPEQEHCQLLSLFLQKAVRLPFCPPDRLNLLLADRLVAKSPENLAIVEKALNWTVESGDGVWSVPRSLGGLNIYSYRRLADTPAVRPETPSVSFDDSTLSGDKSMYVTGMAIRTRRWDGRPVIGGMKIFYSTGDAVEHGVMVRAAGSPEDPSNLIADDTLEEFHLEDGERITSATVRAGFLIDGIMFDTSHGRTLGLYGGQGGGEHKIKSESGSGVYLSYVKGRVDVTQRDTAVRLLELVWVYYKFQSEPDKQKPVPARTKPTHIPPYVCRLPRPPPCAMLV